MENVPIALKKTGIALAVAFGLPVPVQATIEGYEPNDLAPPVNPAYVFDRDLLKDMAVFWESGFKAMKLVGDPAAGKTSIVQEWHARLNAPLALVPCSGGTTEAHLYGQLLPDLKTPGTLRWRDGPVVAAARNGTSVLLDEYNTLDPNVATALNALLEGYAFEIAETGERLRPKPGFRVYATENSVYSKVTVTGRNVQDAANDDRWMVVHVEYMSPDAERKIVADAMIAAQADPTLAQTAAGVIVETANRTRELFRLRGGETFPDDITRMRAEVIERPMSPRTAIRWGVLTHRYRSVTKQGKQPLLVALPRAFSCPNEQMREAVLELAREVSGI